MAGTSRSRSVVGAAGLLGIVLITLAASVYYAFTTPDEYTAKALVQFRPRATDNGGVVGAETTASAAAGYAAYLGAPSTIQNVSATVGLPPEDLKDGIAVQVLPATTVLSVGFSAGSPEVAAQGANALAQSAVARATDDPLVSANVLAQAGIPGAPSGPLRPLIVVAGGILGVLLAAAAYFFGITLRRVRPQSGELWPEDLLDASGGTIESIEGDHRVVIG